MQFKSHTQDLNSGYLKSTLMLEFYIKYVPLGKKWPHSVGHIQGQQSEKSISPLLPGPREDMFANDWCCSHSFLQNPANKC